MKKHGGDSNSRRSRTPRRNIKPNNPSSRAKSQMESSPNPSDQDMEEKDSLDFIYDAKTLEEYKARRVFVFVHHFAGKEDPLSEAMKAHAETAGLRLKIFSVERDSGTGDLLEDTIRGPPALGEEGPHRCVSCRVPMWILFQTQVP